MAAVLQVHRLCLWCHIMGQMLFSTTTMLHHICQCHAAGTGVYRWHVKAAIKVQEASSVIDDTGLPPTYYLLKWNSGAPNEGGHAANLSDRKELICGACSAHEAGSKCQQHGVEFIEWKCRYCCGIASFFCFGTTHMCTACHEEWQLHPGCKQASKHLCTPVNCPLHVRHPDHGLEHCLGCAVCRTHSEY